MTDLTHIATLGDQYIKGLEEKQKDPDKYRPIRTNISELDKRIGGVGEAQYIAIGGPAKSAKTATAQHITTVISSVDRGDVGYFMLEELASQMASRSLARISPNVDRTMMYNLRVDDAGMKELWKANKMLERTSLYVGDVYFTADEIIKVCKEMKLKYATVDYMQLMTDPGIHNESERLASISRKFVKSRNEDGITYIVVYQLNENNKALGSRTIYRDADLLIELSPTKDEETEEIIDGKMDLEVLPSRMCRAHGKFTVNFSGAHSRISDIVILNAITMELSEKNTEHILVPDEGDDYELESPEEWIDPTLTGQQPRLIGDRLPDSPEEERD